MAKVISWQIAGKFVYITPQHGSYILDSQISESERTALKNEAKNWNLQAYTTRFQSMYQAVENMWGTTDLNPNASFYYNALQGEGVYMIGGADGVNTADYGKPFYNLVIENNNTSVGLGGDYVLDKRTDLYTKIYLERNGAFFAPPASDISIVDEVGATTSFSTETLSENGITKTQIKLTIPANTQFDEDYPIKEYTITVVKGDSYTGKTVFTVVGVKDGEEGASYDLVVKPRQIKVTADGDVSNEAVTCSAVRNGIEVINGNGTKLVDELNLQIKYDFGTITDDVDDISNVYRGGISYQDIAENGDQVNFYLIFNGRYLVDSDSCTISRDGKDNGTLKLELDNEMDGISVGSDSKLDISEPVTSSTGFVLYSGGTELEILNSGQNKVKVENLGQNASWTVYGSENNTSTSVEGKKKGWIKFTLNDQFDFGEDYKDSVKITVWGQNEHGEIASATTNYLIMGIRGGKDGEVFKIIPNLDVILCDPNNADTPYVGSETHLTAEAYIGTERIENAEITYSLDVTYGNAYNQTAHLPAAGLDIADLITGASYVALYLWTGDTANPGRRILVDRETVPIMWQGANGSAAWVELGNEIDAISVGWDTDLDLDEELSSVTVGTTVRVISGDTPIQIQDIRIIAPNGKEGHWTSFTERSWDWNNGQGNDEDNDNGTHTIARIFITLLDGFDFDEDLREQATIAVTAGTRDNPWHGYAHYVIKGIPGGKDGYVYRLAPEVDYINFHPNEGHEGTLDFGESNISCDAYYGSTLLDPSSDDPEVNFGTIYYSFNKICTSTGDTETGGYVTGMTIYPSGGVEIDGLITRNNYTNFKYLVFYLVVDGEIVDRETIPIIADGVNGHDSVYIELTNEIDSIGTDTDSKLDLPVGESRKASTGIILHSGSTHLRITNVSGVLSQNSSANPNTYTIGGTIEETSGLTAEFWVEMFNGFEFGSDLKEKAIITVRGTNDDTEEQVSASATFVIAAIKGAKDGVTYKIQPTPDELVYDMDTQKWSGNYNNVFAYAYANGKKMSEQGYRVGVDYEVKTASVIWDLDVATQRWNATDSSLSNYTEGSGIGFATPASPNAREQVIAFYLAVKIGNVWTAVDRETVSLRISGKDGVDGTSSPSFDLTNLIEVITTGTNNVLDISGYKYYYTTVRGRMGTRNVPIRVTTTRNPYGSDSQCRVTTSPSSDNTVQVTVRLGDGFDFTSEQIRKFTINASFESDSSISDTLTFTLKSIQQPDVPEGESYKLRTNVPEVVITGNDYNPETIQAGVYLGKTQKACTIYAKYVSKNDQELTLSQIMSKSTYGNTGTGTTTNPATISVPAVQGIAPNGLLYIAAFDGDDFLDAEDIPVLTGGGSSGILGDLSDEVGVVALGDNDKLEANVVGQLSTKAYIFDGATPMALETVTLPGNGSKITLTGGGQIQFVLNGFVEGATQANISINITASTASYVDFSEHNPLQFDIILNALVDDGEEPIQRTVGYSLLGLRAGKDGDTIHLELNCDQVFHGNEGFDPQEIKCKLYFGGVDITDESDGANPTLRFLIKNSDMADADNTELWLDKFNAEYRSGYYVFPLTEEYTSEYSPLTIRAERNIKKNVSDPDNWVLMDWETVQVLRDGNDGVGGIELKLDQPNYEIEQVDSDKVVTENVSAQTYVSLHSGNTTLDISQIEWLQSQSSYGNGVTFTTGKTQGEPWIMVGIPQDYDFSVNSPTQIRVSATGGTGSDTISRKATFVNTETLGGKGDRGPKTRISEWSSDSVEYLNGSDGDEFWDIVYYRDTATGKGGYFGCKADHTSSNSKKPVPLVGANGEWSVNLNDDYWVYYPNYDFVATKVLNIGEGLQGWVIDEGKIQHTNSSVTLTSAGTIEVGAPVIKYNRYKNGSNYIYVIEGEKIEGDPVVAYEFTGNDPSEAKISELVAMADKFYYSGGDIVKTVPAVNVKCYVDASYNISELDPTNTPFVFLDKPVDFDVYVQVSFIPAGESQATTVICRIDSGETEGYVVRNVYSSSIRLMAGGLEQNENEGGGGQHQSDIIDDNEHIDPREQFDPIDWEQVIDEGDSGVVVVGGDTYVGNYVTVDPNDVGGGIEEDDYLITPDTITSVQVCSTLNGTYGSQITVSNVRVYVYKNALFLYNVYDNSVVAGSPMNDAETRYTISNGTNDVYQVKIDNDKPALKIKNVPYSQLGSKPILGVGYPENSKIYAWSGSSNGTNVYVFTKTKNATRLVFDKNGNYLEYFNTYDDDLEYLNVFYKRFKEITFNDNGEYNFRGASNDVNWTLYLDDFAYTRIYGNGTVVTDSIRALDGEFNGKVKAYDGDFSGNITAYTAYLTNAQIDGGSIIMKNSNAFEMFDAAGNSRALIKNATLSPLDYASMSQTRTITLNDRLAVGSHYSGDGTGLAYNYQIITGECVVYDEILYNGDKITTPNVTVTFSFTHCKHNTSEWNYMVEGYYVYGGGQRVSLVNAGNGNTVVQGSADGETCDMKVYIGANSTHPLGEMKTGSTYSDYTHTVSLSGQYKLYLKVTARFRKKAYQHTAEASVFVKTTNPFKIERMSQTENITPDENKFTVGENGFSYVTKGGGALSVVNSKVTDSQTSPTQNCAAIALYSDYSPSVVGGSDKRPTMGFYIDHNEFVFYVNGVAYSMQKLVQVVSNIKL